MFENIGIGELAVIFGLILLLFGPSRLPDLAASIGKSIRIFKQSMRDEISKGADAADQKEKSA